jgi:hypothetical protein
MKPFRARRGQAHTHAHMALASFALWVRYGLRQSIENVAELKRANPPGLRNPVLTFAVPRALNYVVERFVLEVFQAWELLNAELKRKGLRTLGITHKDYRHLKRIRNKLVAHKIENLIKSRRHETWYKRTYGNYDAVLLLAQRAAERVAARIEHLEISGHIRAPASAPAAQKITANDIAALVAALKAHGIY